MIIHTIHAESPRKDLHLYNALMLDIFGFSFETWHQQSFWGKDYTAYCLIEDGCMIANASVYHMDLLVGGKPQTGYQIGAVATRPEWRGRGLSRRLINHILDQHPGEMFFLCANPSVLNFYPRFGFRHLRERQPYIRCKLENAAVNPYRLDLQTHHAKINTYFEQRGAYSRILDCTNVAPIHWFHLLLEFSQNIYEIPESGVMFVAKQQGDILTIYDICAGAPVHFGDIVSSLPFLGVREIHFGFNPDWLGLDYQTVECENDSTLFVLGELDIQEEFLLPVLTRT